MQKDVQGKSEKIKVLNFLDTTCELVILNFRCVLVNKGPKNMSKKKINSRRKGVSGELEVAKILLQNGYYSRRGQQYSGGPDSPDVICPELKNFHFEVKRVERINIEKSYGQALEDAGDSQMPVVITRKSNSRWKVCMDFEDWLELVKFIYPPAKDKLIKKNETLCQRKKKT